MTQNRQGVSGHAHRWLRWKATFATVGLSGLFVLGPGLYATSSGFLSDSAPAAHATAPTMTSSRVVDSANVLSQSDESKIESALKKLQSDKQIKMQVFFVDSFDGQSGKDWAKAQFDTNPQSNIYIFAVAVNSSSYGTSYGSKISSSTDKAVTSKATPDLSDKKWADAMVAAANELSSGGESSSSSGSAVGWLAGGGAAVIAAGGGIWYVNKRRVKKTEKAMVSDAKKLDPSDTQSLVNLPDNVLEKLSREELTSTDASIRAADDELKLAVAEFGTERARPFIKAMDHSKKTLEHAFSLRSQLDRSTPQSRDSRRSMLIEIISTCGSADRELDSQAESFSKLRGLLIDAPSRLDSLTQQVVDLHTRLPEAKRTLEGLRARYSEQALASVNDNVDMASEHITQAEQAIERGRSLAARPAGEQGGLVDTIRTAEVTCGQADELLKEVENADSRIAEAKDRLDAIIQEITDELHEAGQLRNNSATTGAEFNQEAMDDVAKRAWESVEHAQSIRDTNPLGAYKELIAIDAQLDEQLDQAKDSAQQQDRALQIFDRAESEASAQVSAADKLISTRGQAVGAQPRTLLAQSVSLLSDARGMRTTDTRRAIELAREASTVASNAQAATENDIDDFNRRNRNNFGGGSGGAFLAGMIASSLLNGGNHNSWGGGGGWDGGGFGGGDWGGGGFGGGDWGGGSDGAF